MADQTGPGGASSASSSAVAVAAPAATYAPATAVKADDEPAASSDASDPAANAVPAALFSSSTAAVAGASHKPQPEASGDPQRLSCTKYFDQLWFCYSPYHQMQHYYRYGVLDDCFGKWSGLLGCLNLKTKRSAEVQMILEEREKAKTQAHIWTYRTVEEASINWWNMHSHFFNQEPPY